MIDSLTVSVLLFVALAIGAVVAWDAWRAWRLRRLSVERPVDTRRPHSDEAGGQSTAVPAATSGPGRAEPSFGFDSQTPSVRPEPELTMRADDAATRPPAPAPREQTALWSTGPDALQPDSGPASSPPPGVGVAEHLPPARPLGPAPTRGVGGQWSAASSPAEDVAALSESAVAPADRSAGTSMPSSSSGAVPSPAPSEAPVGTSPSATTGALQHLSSAASSGVDSVSGPTPSGAVISDRTDCIALLRFLQPVACDRVLVLTQSFRRAGSKPVLVEAAEQGGGGAVLWSPLKNSQWCMALRFGLLLANRAGPLNALEYTDFAQRVRDIASTLGVGVDVPDMSSALARARDLDAQSAQLDATICVNVDAGEVLGPSQLASLATPLAITERGNNRYARLGSRGETIFSVALGERSNRLSFLLDLPRVDPQAQAFVAMLESARVAARRLPGRLVDDEGRTLNERSLEQISRGIEQRQQALAAAGLAAGSLPALRVFN